MEKQPQVYLNFNFCLSTVVNINMIRRCLGECRKSVHANAVGFYFKETFIIFSSCISSVWAPKSLPYSCYINLQSTYVFLFQQNQKNKLVYTKICSTKRISREKLKQLWMLILTLKCYFLPIHNFESLFPHKSFYVVYSFIYSFVICGMIY